MLYGTAKLALDERTTVGEEETELSVASQGRPVKRGLPRQSVD